MRLRLHDDGGWLTVAACFLVTLCVGEVMWSFGVFFKALEAEFGWSRALISSSYTGLAMAQAASAILAGRLADRHPSRAVLIGSALIAGPAIMACSQISTPAQLQILLIVAGVGTGATVSLPMTVVQRRFRGHAHSSVALAVVASGIGVGALVFAPLINHAILALGWRTAFVAAGLTFSLLVGSAALAIGPNDVHSRNTGDQRHKSSAAVRRAIATPQFLGVIGIAIVAMFAFQALSVHLVPYATDTGISMKASAAALGLVGGISVPGRLASGFASQRLGWSKTLALSLAGCGAAILTLPLVNTDHLLYCFVAAYGFCHGVRAVAVFGLVGRLFAGEALGELTGIVVACANVVGALGPYVVGHVFDLSGSYSATFVAVGALLALSALLPIVLRLDARTAEETVN